MKQEFVLLLLLIFTSCNYFDVKKTSSDVILKEELKSINWNEVDVYPAFAVCDSSSTTIERKNCFEYTLTRHIQDQLAKKKLIVSRELVDTIKIEFKLSDKGEISILNMKISKNTLTELPGIERELFASIDSLPKIYPAIKRGQLVNTQFKLPIIIKSD